MTVWICETRSQKKSEEGARRQIIGSANQRAFSEDKKSDRPIRLLWQEIQVGRTNQIHRSDFHTDQISVPTNQILRSDFHTNHISVPTDQILRSDFHTYHLYVSANQILQSDLHTDQISVSTNHILRADLPTDHLSVSANKILRTDLPMDHLSVSSNQILRSFIGRNPQEINSSECSRTTRVTRARSPSLSTTHHSNNLRSHERDGRNLRKKSPRAKAVRSRTH